MEVKKVLFEDLEIYCATDKSYCWAYTTSKRHVEVLHKYAFENNFKSYFGKTNSGNFYACIDNGVQNLAMVSSPNVVRGTYRDGDVEKSAIFCLLDTPDQDLDGNGVEEPTLKEPDKAAQPVVEESPEVVVNEEQSEVESQPEPEQDVSAESEARDYKALYEELAEHYNNVVAQLNAIYQAFDVIKALLK